MNLVSFVDELIKIGAMDMFIQKHAYGGDGDQSDVNTVDVPHGMMGSGSPPEALRVAPDDATTRIPVTAHLPPLVQSGHLGDVTSPKDPIDRFKYNRAYRDRR